MRKTKGLLFGAVLVFMMLHWTNQGYSQEIAGTGAYALDGDTIELDGEPLRLFGIDAPELGQTCLNGKKRWRCGLEAAFALSRLVSKEPITCTVHGDGRPVPEASCTIARGDVAEIIVTRGFAQTSEETLPNYSVAEKEAQAAKLGIWRGEFVAPGEWRKGKRLPMLDDVPAEICDIKGTIGENGRKIYVVPTDTNYDAVTIDADKGERLFCSDDEARLAGWQRFGQGIRQ